MCTVCKIVKIHTHTFACMYLLHYYCACREHAGKLNPTFNQAFKGRVMLGQRALEGYAKQEVQPGADSPDRFPLARFNTGALQKSLSVVVLNLPYLGEICKGNPGFACPIAQGWRRMGGCQYARFENLHFAMCNSEPQPNRTGQRHFPQKGFTSSASQAASYGRWRSSLPEPVKSRTVSSPSYCLFVSST